MLVGRWSNTSSSLPKGRLHVALPPGGAARSQVDQGERHDSHKLNYKINHSETFKGTKIVIHSLQPSCDAQDIAIYQQVTQMGHTSQQCRYTRVPGFAGGSDPFNFTTLNDVPSRWLEAAPYRGWNLALG